VSAYRTCNDMVASCCGMCNNVDVCGLCYDLAVCACGICNDLGVIFAPIWLCLCCGICHDVDVCDMCYDIVVSACVCLWYMQRCGYVCISYMP